MYSVYNLYISIQCKSFYGTSFQSAQSPGLTTLLIEVLQGGSEEYLTMVLSNFVLPSSGILMF